MNNDLISREALKKKFERLVDETIPYGGVAVNDMRELIDNAPTVELNESVIQEVLNKRCMTAVANEYLIALHGKKPQGEWIDVNGDGSLWKCNNCGEKSCCKGNYCPDCGAKMKDGAE